MPLKLARFQEDDPKASNQDDFCDLNEIVPVRYVTFSCAPEVPGRCWISSRHAQKTMGRYQENSNTKLRLLVQPSDQNWRKNETNRKPSCRHLFTRPIVYWGLRMHRRVLTLLVILLALGISTLAL
jgi:hypothetical protein